MKVLFTFMKRAEKDKNRIIIPRFIIKNYGRDFKLEILEDGSMKLTPMSLIKKEGK